MADVIKVYTTRDYSLFEKLFFKGSVFYITDPGCVYKSTYVFDEKGDLLGTINGDWYDFAEKTLFKQKTEDK